MCSPAFPHSRALSQGTGVTEPWSEAQISQGNRRRKEGGPCSPEGRPEGEGRGQGLESPEWTRTAAAPAWMWEGSWEIEGGGLSPARLAEAQRQWPCCCHLSLAQPARLFLSGLQRTSTADLLPSLPTDCLHPGVCVAAFSLGCKDGLHTARKCLWP